MNLVVLSHLELILCGEMVVFDGLLVTAQDECCTCL